ncbi:MAG: alpha/beta fold hydrolase [Alphaproteobacteria bacterium]|nr:alpha/beta fold hydrolase [Alphaproteobacteria bacterium]
MEIDVAGTRVFAATGGRPFDPTLPTVAFVHGAGMDHTVWTLQTRWFAHHGRNALAFDLPGHGRSQGAALASIDAMADFIVRATGAAGARQAAIVGHSMGALVGLSAAARHPGSLRALALLGAAARMPVHPKLLDAARRNDPSAVAMIADWAFGRRAQIGGARAPGTWMVGGGTRLLERARPGVLASDLAACDSFAGAPDAARSVRCPVLVLLGDGDRMTPAAGGRALADAIPGALVRTVPGAGHMAMIERPDETLAALAEVC